MGMVFTFLSLTIKDILFYVGVPWILEMVSTGTATEHGFDETCWVRVGLDMANLLAVRIISIYKSARNGKAI